MSTRKRIAGEVAERLRATEVAIDNALAEAAALAGFMPLARMDAKLAAEVGHEALVSAGGVVTMLISARSGIVDAHRALLATQLQIGVRELATGDLGSKPSRASADLRVVGAVEERAA